MTAALTGPYATTLLADHAARLEEGEELLAAGVDVATDEPRRLVYPALGLSVLAVPHPAVAAARELNVSRTTMWRLMKKHNVPSTD